MKSAKTLGNESVQNSLYERLIFENLVALKELIIKNNVNNLRSQAVTAGVVPHQIVQERSLEAVKDDLMRVENKLTKLQGPSAHHKITAYSQLSRDLISEIHYAIFSDNRNELETLKTEIVSKKLEYQTVYHELSNEITNRDKIINALEKDKHELQNQIAQLSRSNSSLQSECQKIFNEIQEIRKNETELKMQALDFKAETEKRCDLLLGTVQSVIGFIPNAVRSHISFLRLLKVSDMKCSSSNF